MSAAAPTIHRLAPVLGPGGERIELFQLDHPAGASALLSSYGASLISLEVPDGRGQRGQVVLGFPDPLRYLGSHPHFGCTVGRFANRIAGAAFELEGRRYELTRNEGPNHLHGGAVGLHRTCFDADPWCEAEAVGTRFRTVCADGHEGYPGTLTLEVGYTLHGGNTMRIDYQASVDRPSVLSLTHHSYFNLADGGTSHVLDHEVSVAAERYVVVDSAGLPTGELVAVKGTPLDLRRATPLRAGVGRLTERGGYDHCFAIEGDGLRLCASVYEPTSARTLEVFSTQPALQLYTGNFLDGTLVGHGERCYQRFAGLCLETQHPPDAPNQPGFASAQIDPRHPYAHAVEYRFGVRAP